MHDEAFDCDGDVRSMCSIIGTSGLHRVSKGDDIGDYRCYRDARPDLALFVPPPEYVEE